MPSFSSPREVISDGPQQPQHPAVHHEDKVEIGLPDAPKKAKRAGRDEMIRRMSAHGMAHTQIAEITGYSRSTVDIAVNRARALRIDDDEDIEVDLAAVATRLSALLELIDQSQSRSGNGNTTIANASGD